MMIEIMDPNVDTTRGSQAVCMTIAAGLHALLLYWNPTILSSDFKATHDFVSVDIVEQALPNELPSAPMEEKHKLGLMEALQNMLMKPKMEEIAHPAPEPVAHKVAAPVAQPALREKLSARTMPTFKPTSQTEDLAATSAPGAIKTPTRNAVMPTNTPSLTAKTLGIRVKDMPFQVGGQDEALAGANATVIPVAVGNKSAKTALGYSNPALQDSGKQRFTGLTPKLGGPSSDLSAAGAAPANIALSGTGGSGNAPTGATSGASLTSRPGSGLGGGGLVSKTMYGSSGGGLGRGAVSIPSAAAELDQKLAASATASIPKNSKRGFDLAGPLNNRTITKKKIPQYPSWAEEQGIIGSVRIYFTVTPEGAVRSNMQIRKTTGYPELDKLALEALSQWTFAPFASDDESSQWGIITFTFSLAS